MKTNSPLATRYEFYASQLGIQFPSRQEQEAYSTAASTDQGDVSYEIPSIQGVFKIETPKGVDNQTPEFTDVLPGQH